MMYKSQIICIVIILFIEVFRRFSYRETRSTRRFTAVTVMSVIQLIFDIASVYSVNHLDTVNPIVNRIIHTLFMGLMLLIFVLGFKYLEVMIEEEKGEPIKKSKTVIVAFVLGVLGLCLLPLVYIETPVGNYSHGPAVIALFACVYYCIGLVVSLLIKHSKDIPAKKRIAVTIAMLSEAPVAVFQMLVPTSLVSCLAIVLFILGLYMTVENPDAKLVKMLEKETKRADIANKAKTNFLANMSHEIRTPINAVLGMNEMILRESSEETVREYARDVQGSAKSLLSIINDILDVTKIEAGKLEIFPVEYDFESMIHDVVNMISFKAKAKELEFKVDIDSRIPKVLFGDDIRVRQILVNILNNAVKYTHKGSVEFRIELMSAVFCDGDVAELFFEVSDTGIGIKEEDIEKLFVPFERIEEKRNRSIEGTGLGINITMQLLDMLGSKLEVRSVYGEGSVFSFALKQKVVDSTPIVGIFEDLEDNTTQDSEYKITYEAPDAKVLVVDDNDMNRKVFRSLLKGTKIQVDDVNSGKGCLEKVVQNKYDIIFMDHMMPEMDGVETFEKMKEMPDNKCKDTPVVILTANAIAGAKEQYLSQGFNAFLPKPIDTQKNDDMIKELISEDKIHFVKDVAYPRETKKTYNISDLPVVDGLDWAFANMHFINAEDMMEAIKMFVFAIDSEAKELEKHYIKIYDEKSRDNFRIKVHSMKSSAAMIGIVPLAGMAKVLEDAARSGDCNTIRQMLPTFLRYWYSFKEKLSQFAEEDTGTKSAREFETEVNAIFGQIRVAAKEMDLDVLDISLEKLKEYRFEGKQKELFSKIQDAIVNLDVDFLENVGK